MNKLLTTACDRRLAPNARPGLGRAQGIHAGVGAPWSFVPVGRAVNHAHVAHAIPRQGEGQRLPAHAAANHQHVDEAPTSGPCLAGTQSAAG